jgi:lipoprotein-anchoring transpeptidase ErfK/SrfK
MVLRTAGLIIVLLLGLAGTTGPVLAQFLPLPAPQILPPPFRPLPPAAIEDDNLPYDPPPDYRRVPPPPGTYATPPRGNDPAYGPPPGPQYGRGTPLYPQDVESAPLPPPGAYREQPAPSYEPIEPPNRVGRPDFADQPPAYEPEPPAQIGRPNQGLLPNPLDLLRPPAAIGPEREAVLSALPPEERPETGPMKELPAHLRRTTVDFRTREPVGTIVIDTPNTYLYLVLGNGKAMRYGIGVGREGFTWAGAERISRMAEWPDWHPPSEMIERQPYLPRFMAGGEGNPLGARALYLGKTLYRIHGTNQPSTIGTFVSSGCIRLINEDITDLYYRVNVGTRVVVLPGRPPASASAAPIGSDPGEPPQPYNPLAPPRTR